MIEVMNTYLFNRKAIYFCDHNVTWTIHIVLTLLIIVGGMQILCESNICDEFRGSRGDACRVKIDVPTNCAGNSGRSCSLIFHFHGAGGNNNRAKFQDQIRKPDLQPGFIGVYPQGVDRQWNTGSQKGIGNIDEGAFISEIVSTLKKFYQWNGLKFAVGSSNGAAQTNRMATNSGYGFDGVVASATQLISSPVASGPGNLNSNIITEYTRPIAYLSLHGSADTVIPANGGELFKTGFILSSVDDTLDRFAALNSCKNSTNRLATSILNSGSISTATIKRFSCPSIVPVEGVMVEQGGHGVGRSIDGVSKNEYIFNWILAVRNNL